MAPIVECLLGPAETPVGNDTYVFARDARGRYVADVQNIKHVAILTGLPAYAEVRDEAASSTALTPLADQAPVVEPPAPAPAPAPASTAAPSSAPATPSADGDADQADEETETLDDEDFEGHPESEEEEAEMNAASADEQNQYLLGSDILPEVIAISAQINVGLGDVVNRAFADSGLALAEWNGLSVDDRENRLLATINVMQKEAAPAAEDPPADFAVLHGIGKASAEKLHKAGVLTFQQLAELSVEQLAELDKQLGLNGLSIRGKWNELALAHLTDPK